MLVYLNGDVVPKEEARIPVDDRGFVFGDGVYEVTRAVQGRLFEEEAHWRRMERGLSTLGIEAGSVLDQARLREVSLQLLAENGLTDRDATVYVQITRGVAPRTHWYPPAGTAPTVYVSTAAFTVPEELRTRGAEAITQADIRWSRCDLKTVNLLPNVVAKQRAREAGAFEAVLIRNGAVTEGASTNLFAVLDGELRTHPESNYILPGITRRVVIELAGELGIPVSTLPFFEEDLPRLSELFATGTTTDVQPLVRLDGRPVGEGVPGPVGTALQAALARRMGLPVPGEA